MIETIQTLNFYLSVGGIVAFLLAAILVFDLKRSRSLATHIRTYGLLAALIITGGGLVMALVYSEVFGFEPCGLCWLARILLFPKVLLLLTALYYKDTNVARYGIALSVTGIFITLYHHYLQMGGTEFVRCPSAGDTDCAQRFLFEFGFMTFPLLATATFTLLVALYYYILKSR